MSLRSRIIRRRLAVWLVALCAPALLSLAVPGLVAPALATSGTCSTSTGASSCTIGANVTVTAGTLSLQSSPNLYWSFVGTGYDQWASGSASALSGCTASGSTTTCSGGTRPMLLVVDPTGSGSGWALSEYLSGSNLPSGAVLHFNGTGSGTVGNSSASPIASDPFTPTTPGNVCDYGSGCTAATPASTCSQTSLGFSTCPAYPVAMGGTSTSSQVDLYSAAASSGLGAICFASGTATATGCTGTTPTAFYDLGIQANTPVGNSYGTTINMAVNSGP